MSEIKVTYILNPVCEKYISRFLFTLYKYQNPEFFRVVLIDQVEGRMSSATWDYIKDKVHLYIHPPQKQLGFSKSMNEGILHGLHWGTPLICLANDDIEIMDSRWMDGIGKTFALNEKIMGVIPMSPRVAGFGYGVKYNPEVLPYKEEYTKEEYDYLLRGDFSDVKGLPKTMSTNMKGTVVDGGAFIMPYFKREIFDEIGLLDERFFPSGGEDYDYLARVYQKGYRIVSTSYSWVYHLWGKSQELNVQGKLDTPYYQWKPYWNNFGEIWPEGHDIWGFKEVDGKKIPYPRVPEIFVDQI